MLRFQLFNRDQVSVDPRQVVSVLETSQEVSTDSELMRRAVAKITMTNGEFYFVLDPNRTVAHQISQAKK